MEVKNFILVLYGVTGRSTSECMTEEANEVNGGVKKVVEKGLEEYAERMMAIGDFHSLANAELNGIGLSNAVVVDDSLVSTMMESGLSDQFREFHPDMPAI